MTHWLSTRVVSLSVTTCCCLLPAFCLLPFRSDIISMTRQTAPKMGRETESLSPEASSRSVKTPAPALTNYSAVSESRVPDRFSPDGSIDTRKLPPHSHADISKMAWVHFPKTGSSILNLFLTVGCPTLPSGVFVRGGSFKLWGFVASKHRISCKTGFSVCDNHRPISARRHDFVATAGQL